MRVFQTFRRNVIVPVDTTIAEPFVLRCLFYALQPVPTNLVTHTLARVVSTNMCGEIEHLTYALRSISAAHQCHHLHHPNMSHNTLSVNPPVQSLQTSDTLLDTLVPRLVTKCDLDTLDFALNWCELSAASPFVTMTPSTDEMFGENSFSLCTMLAATQAAKHELARTRT